MSPEEFERDIAELQQALCTAERVLERLNWSVHAWVSGKRLKALLDAVELAQKLFAQFVEGER